MKDRLNKRTPLEIAIHNLNIEVVNLLFERGADISSGNLYNLVTSAFTDTIESDRTIPMIELLLNKASEKGIDINVTDEFGNTILESYITRYADSRYYFDINIIQLLLDRGANIDFIDQSGDTYLMCMIKRSYINSIKIIQLLLERGANINIRDKSGKTPLMIAFEHKNIKIVELLLERGANIDPSIKNKLNLNNSDSDIIIKRKILNYVLNN